MKHSWWLKFKCIHIRAQKAGCEMGTWKFLSIRMSAWAFTVHPRRVGRPADRTSCYIEQHMYEECTVQLHCGARSRTRNARSSSSRVTRRTSRASCWCSGPTWSSARHAVSPFSNKASCTRLRVYVRCLGTAPLVQCNDLVTLEKEADASNNVSSSLLSTPAGTTTWERSRSSLRRSWPRSSATCRSPRRASARSHSCAITCTFSRA